jgi:arabinofuranosyltransferase
MIKEAAMRRLVSPLAVLLFLLVLWGGWFIYRSSFVIEGKRYFTLFDDSMISMTYARNLLAGHGLNWARWGEPVEGFTHPLWLLLMIPVNALPVPLPDRSLLMQIVSLLSLLGTVLAVRRLVLDHFAEANARHWLPAAVLTAFYYPLAYWTLMGMETGLQALLAVLAVHLTLAAAHGGRDRHLALWLVCTAAYLLRMDMLLLVVAVQLYLLLRGGLRPAGRQSWLMGLAVFCGVSLAYSLFRWFYFHDLLPNTYYLKLTGVALTVRLLRGISVLADFLREHLLFILPVGLAAGVLLRRNARIALPAGVFVLYCAYCVYTGGDAWDGDLPVRANRFIAFVMPLLFVMFNAVLNAALSAWRRGREEGSDPLLQPFFAAGATAVSLLLVNGLWLSSEADDNWRRFTLTERPPNVDRHERVVGSLQAFERLVQPGAVVATAWAGIPAYFSDYRMIDILGYNDRTVAHMPPVVELGDDDFRFFRPGHLKWNQQRLLGEQRPDAFFQIWGVRRGMGEVTEVLPRYGYHKVGGFWMRADSPYVHPATAVTAKPAPTAAEMLDFNRKPRSKRAKRAAEAAPP